MSANLDRILDAYGRHNADEAQECFGLGAEFEHVGNLEAAATAYDRAYGLDTADTDIQTARQRVLNRLAVLENGIHFRYIPAGTFLMGSASGDPDEAPVHPIRLGAYWISETPVSWAGYCSLMNWPPPPVAMPPPEFPSPSGVGGLTKKTIVKLLKRTETPKPANQNKLYRVSAENRVRLQYCEDHTTRAIDWHAHAPEQQWSRGGQPVSSKELFGEPPRADATKPWGYSDKPMVSVCWFDAAAVGRKLATSTVVYCLPTEAEWEKAARGGSIDCPYPWGHQAPSTEMCDFARFDQLSILPMMRFAPNGYGLYAMSGGVWEWTSDWYDAQYYAASPRCNPKGPEQGQEKVLRGGSWTDCAEALTVSFRMSRLVRDEDSWGSGVANIGFRLCRRIPTP
jgi:formylglycine-generating enzyme